MKVAISVESTHDLTPELLKKYDIKVIPFEIVLGNQTFFDGEKSNEEIFDYVDKNGVLPHTTALNEYQYTEYFENLKKEYDEVVHIALSSGITSSCNNAINGGKNVNGVYVVDSQNLTSGIGLLSIYARELADSGLTGKEIAEKLDERKNSLQVSFVIETLEYLHKGGRCSTIKLLGANLLKFRPRVVVKNGKMSSDKKYRGSMPMVVDKYCQDTLAEFNTPDLDKIIITYSSASKEMIDTVYKHVKEAGFKTILETVARGTVASHCGRNTIGIIYFNDGKKN